MPAMLRDRRPLRVGVFISAQSLSPSLNQRPRALHLEQGKGADIFVTKKFM